MIPFLVDPIREVVKKLYFTVSLTVKYPFLRLPFAKAFSKVVNAWYNGPVTGRVGCFSFAMFGMLGGLALVHFHHNRLPNCHLYHLSTNTTITIFKSLYGCFEMFELQLSKTALVDEFSKL